MSHTPNTPANGGQILTWQERAIKDGGSLSMTYEARLIFMKAEIADLRAALAAPAIPTVDRNAVPSGDVLRAIVRSASTSATDGASPQEYILAGWNAAIKSADAASVPSDYHDAYRGARDDFQDWKNRAQRAEESCRRLTAALNDENGPMHMGEPADGYLGAGKTDERALFEYSERASDLSRDNEGDYSNPYVQSTWDGWQARAVLAAAPASEPVQPQPLCNSALRAELAGQHSAQDEWLPIETAPRDGTMILLGRMRNEAEDRDAISTAGRWQKGWEDSIDDMGCDDGFVDVDYNEFWPPRSFGAESHRSAGCQPTHWKPRPDAPGEQTTLPPGTGGEQAPTGAAPAPVSGMPDLEGLQRDAERYRWLRDKSEPGICAFYLSVGKAFDGVKFTQATVDEAIDSQIAADVERLLNPTGATK